MPCGCADPPSPWESLRNYSTINSINNSQPTTLYIMNDSVAPNALPTPLSPSSPQALSNSLDPSAPLVPRSSLAPPVPLSHSCSLAPPRTSSTPVQHCELDPLATPKASRPIAPPQPDSPSAPPRLYTLVSHYLRFAAHFWASGCASVLHPFGSTRLLIPTLPTFWCHHVLSGLRHHFIH